jgi:exonuclease VII large subunit
MRQLLHRMSELAKGIQDEHMNREALEEMARQEGSLGGLDEVERMLARGDVEGAARALDALGSEMEAMLRRLERTAGEPDERQAELSREMRGFQKKLEGLEREQQRLAGETEAVRQEYRRRIADQVKRMEEGVARMQARARQAREELERARPGVPPRAEEDYGQARERLQDLEKALQTRDFEAALDSARRALPTLQRLAAGLEDDASLAERFPQARQKPPLVLRDAGRHAAEASRPTRQVRDELERLFPDPRSVLPRREQERLGGLARRQGELEREAGGLRQKLQELAQRAPVFPPQAQGMLGEAQGHMAQAQGELAQRNPQRGHGEQRQALDALSRFRKGMEEAARQQQRAGGRGGGFPFPFAMGEEAGEGGDGDLSRERVEIPGADAYKVPEEFRRDILEAMKQGAPEPYRPELQRYYEELVR